MINRVSRQPVTLSTQMAVRARNVAAQRTALFSMDTSLAGTVRPVRKESQAEVPAAPSRGQVLNSTPDLHQFFDNKAAAPPAPPFVPAFRAATGSGVGNDGTPVSWSLNKTYFASRETAQWIANKYGTGQVIEVPFGGAGGPFSASATEYHIKLADGRTVNAGILAGYYERNPEDKFPGLAEKLIRSQLGV